MTVVTTGSAVLGLIPGMNKHMGGGVAVVYLQDGDPNGIVTAPQSSAAPSGLTVGWDALNGQLYHHTTGSTWQKLGSVQ